MINIESRPLDADNPADAAILARLQALPQSMFIFDWQVVGEGIVRGQMFQADLWRYVRIGDHLSYLDVTAEFMYNHVDGEDGAHRYAMYKLVTGQTSGVLR